MMLVLETQDSMILQAMETIFDTMERFQQIQSKHIDRLLEMELHVSRTQNHIPTKQSEHQTQNSI